MVTKLKITDNTNTPVRYLSEVPYFKNCLEIEFKSGVNIIVGENGCGKTTLMKLLKSYLMVDYNECDRGIYNHNINRMYGMGDGFLDGADVYADYHKNTFRFCHANEKSNDASMKDFNAFGELITSMNSSTGESIIYSLNYLFKLMFSKDAKLTFDYKNQFEELYPDYVKYADSHRVECEDEWTILMDEPDRNLSIDNISRIKEILSIHKPHTQVIAVIHNPLLIYSLSKKSNINWIELTEGYIDNVKEEVKLLLR